MRFVANITPGGSVKFVGGAETVELKGGEQFYAMTTGEIEVALRRKVELDASGSPIMTEDESQMLSRTLPILSRMRLLSPRQQRQFIKHEKKRIDRERRENIKVRDDAGAKLAMINKCKLAYVEIMDWAGEPLVLEKPPSTLFHKLREAVIDGEALIFDTVLSRGRPQDYEEVFDDASVFVVEHDWASAFKNAADYGTGEFKLPDDVCAFEFRISGRHIIAVTFEMDGVLWMNPQILTEQGWVIPACPYKLDADGRWRTTFPQTLDLGGPTKDYFEECAQLVCRQIRAVAIALDAEVAVSDVVRADHKLNHARERRGKLPINSYHVVSLARRTRAAPLPRDPDHEPERHNRMHFVRGHWRHYEQHKTWIKWHLRGDPDLGFIDKHYKL